MCLFFVFCVLLCVGVGVGKQRECASSALFAKMVVFWSSFFFFFRAQKKKLRKQKMMKMK